MSSILESFYIDFLTNSEQVKKGVGEAETATAGLEARLASTDAAVAAVGEHIIETFGRVALRLAAFFSIEQSAEFISSLSEVNAQLGVTAERLGVSVEDLGAYQQATERAGGSAEGFTQTLDFLNRGIADIATKGTSRLKPFFDELKIKTDDGRKHVRPLLDILGDLAAKFQTMGAQQRAGIAEKLGIDEGTVLLLAQGRRGLDDLVQKQKELGVATKEDAEIAHHYRQALEDLEQQFRHWATTLGSEIFPKLEEFFKWIGKITNYLSAHKGLVEGFFVGVAGVITALYLPAISAAVVETAAFIGEWLLILGPIIAVGVAIGLVVDDVQNFLKGNKSVIGELSKTWPIVGQVVREVVADIGAAIQWLVAYYENAASLLFAIVNRVSGIFGRFGHDVVAALSAVGNWINSNFPAFGAMIRGFGDIVEWLVKLLAEAVGWFLKLGASAVAGLPKALGHWAATLNADEAAARQGHTATYAEEAAARAKADHPGGGDKPRQVDVPRPTPHPGGPVPGHTLPPHSEVAKMVLKAQAAIHTADTTPLAAVSGGATIHGPTTVNKKVVIENLVVQTQATDSQEISHTIRGHLEKEIGEAMDHFDDGVQN